MNSIAPEYTDAASRPADEDAILNRMLAKSADARRAAQLGAEAIERARYVADLRRRLSEAEDAAHASVQADLIAVQQENRRLEIIAEERAHERDAAEAKAKECGRLNDILRAQVEDLEDRLRAAVEGIAAQLLATIAKRAVR